MTPSFYFSTKYVLDKSHFAETFDESVTKAPSLADYYKSIALAFVGFLILYFTDVMPYAGWFIVVLGVVEMCSVKFRKPWWLLRQMFSRAANTELTLVINDEGIISKSFCVDSTLFWKDMDKVERTSKGWLFSHNNGRTYLSARCLSKEAMQYIQAKSTSLPSEPVIN